MREIKFRGYAVEEMVNSQWIYGTGLHKIVFTDEYAERTGIKEEWFIFTDSGWEQVVPESVGEFTGLEDSAGTEVFEGDILHRDGFWDFVVSFSDGCFRKEPRDKIQSLNWKHDPLTGSWLKYDGYVVSGNMYEIEEELENETN